MSKKDDTWRTNIKSKGQEIQSLIDQLLSVLPDPANRHRFNELLAKTITRCEVMHDLFGPNQVPGTLSHITGQLKAWKNNLNAVTHLKNIVALQKSIGLINGDDEAEISSFTSILEKHREDETLQKFLTDLIAALEALIADGDDVFTKQIVDELDRILNEIRKRKGLSLPDLKPWVDFAIVSTGAIVDSFTGNPIATVAAGAIVAAKSSQIRIQTLFALAQTEFIESLQLKGRKKFEGEFGKSLIEAPLELIEVAIQSPEGLKSLAPKNELPFHTEDHMS